MLIRHLACFGIALFLSGALTACESENVNSQVHRTGGDGDGDPQPKPIPLLSNRVMLSLAGLAELHELLSLALGPADQLGCATRTPEALEWGCREHKSRPAIRQGRALFTHQGERIRLTTDPTDPLDMKVWVKTDGHTLPVVQDVDLVINKGDLHLTSEYSYQLPKAGVIIRYNLIWQIEAKISGKAPNFSLNDTVVILNISRSQRGHDQNFQYKLSAPEQSLKLGECGKTIGRFLFEGNEQEQLVVQADGQDVRADKTKNRYPWPECSTNLYGLKLAAPMWRQPEP